MERKLKHFSKKHQNKQLFRKSTPSTDNQRTKELTKELSKTIILREDNDVRLPAQMVHMGRVNPNFMQQYDRL